MRILKKKKNRAFGKDIYLLGKDSSGAQYWLEAPSWDCDWYWGFGYVETYTNNTSPSKSRDISSHQHIDSSFMGEGNAKSGGYCHNIFDSKLLEKTTFTEEEGWELSELFKTFYLLSDYAGFLYMGGVGISKCDSIQALKSKEKASIINKRDIPLVTARIVDILSPSDKVIIKGEAKSVFYLLQYDKSLSRNKVHKVFNDIGEAQRVAKTLNEEGELGAFGESYSRYTYTVGSSLDNILNLN